MYFEVVLNVPLNQTFTYSQTDKESEIITDSLIGYRCEVYFRSRKLIGCIVNQFENLPENFIIPVEKIKPIIKIVDSEPIVNQEQILLSEWISKYYLCSVGEALFSMLPSGKRETNITGISFEEDAFNTKALSLSQEQTLAIQGILDDKSSYLHYLYGPTGSGKTEVFLQVAEKIYQQGLGIIYLVPEIGLTHQVIESTIKRFGNTVAILHSGLTGSQKLKEWMRIIHREARIVIGARSAVFAPIPDLGLIIIDEEHDASYKSGTTPRYHARQVAMKRCATLKIPLVMGSATPSVEAWYLIQNNKILSHNLSKRLAGGKEPDISIINLSKQKENGIKNDGAISKQLEDEIRNVYSEKKQSILFLNRRGFSNFFKCSSCGFELKCKYCSVSMTYHKAEKKLVCHYCGLTIAPPSQCPECGSFDIGYFGYGTEFIENEVHAKFPNCKIERIDTDNLKSKTDLQKKIDSFRKGDIDILLGTQMVAKGLNFPNLKLVGVIMADTGLHLPDFRAAERTFSLIVQVAGRAGRYFPDGKVFVQSYTPERPAIYYSCNNLIKEFYDQELEQRELLQFPPYSRLIRLVFRSARLELAINAAQGAFEIFTSFIEKKLYPEFEILGPCECPLSKIAANYRHQILLRYSKISVIQDATARFFHDYKISSNVYIEVDVDPINLL